MPVNSVWNGIGLSAAPTIVSRSAGTPRAMSQSTAFSASTTTSTAIASTPMPE